MSVRPSVTHRRIPRPWRLLLLLLLPVVLAEPAQGWQIASVPTFAGGNSQRVPLPPTFAEEGRVTTEFQVWNGGTVAVQTWLTLGPVTDLDEERTLDVGVKLHHVDEGEATLLVSSRGETRFTDPITLEPGAVAEYRMDLRVPEELRSLEAYRTRIALNARSPYAMPGMGTGHPSYGSNVGASGASRYGMNTGTSGATGSGANAGYTHNGARAASAAGASRNDGRGTAERASRNAGAATHSNVLSREELVLTLQKPVAVVDAVEAEALELALAGETGATELVRRVVLCPAWIGERWPSLCTEIWPPGVTVALRNTTRDRTLTDVSVSFERLVQQSGTDQVIVANARAGGAATVEVDYLEPRTTQTGILELPRFAEAGRYTVTWRVTGDGLEPRSRSLDVQVRSPLFTALVVLVLGLLVSTLFTLVLKMLPAMVRRSRERRDLLGRLEELEGAGGDDNYEAHARIRALVSMGRELSHALSEDWTQLAEEYAQEAEFLLERLERKDRIWQEASRAPCPPTLMQRVEERLKEVDALLVRAWEARDDEERGARLEHLLDEAAGMVDRAMWPELLSLELRSRVKTVLDHLSSGESEEAVAPAPFVSFLEASTEQLRAFLEETQPSPARVLEIDLRVEALQLLVQFRQRSEEARLARAARRLSEARDPRSFADVLHQERARLWWAAENEETWSRIQERKADIRIEPPADGQTIQPLVFHVRFPSDEPELRSTWLVRRGLEYRFRVERVRKGRVSQDPPTVTSSPLLVVTADRPSKLRVSVTLSAPDWVPWTERSKSEAVVVGEARPGQPSPSPVAAEAEPSGGEETGASPAGPSGAAQGPAVLRVGPNRELRRTRYYAWFALIVGVFMRGLVAVLAGVVLFYQGDPVFGSASDQLKLFAWSLLVDQSTKRDSLVTLLSSMRTGSRT